MNMRTSKALQIAAALLLAGLSPAAATEAVFNVKDYGATGRKSDDARSSIQNLSLIHI